ncbi:MAG: phospho-N-acetylmuramoyl-pentapeptide-transferase [Candidatus Blackburnbacteria bacterium]|nr:phospho-N-acetylmuramoyl-pentapeptide-transferase [Candidatus Blackburnbacteria bacterium]
MNLQSILPLALGLVIFSFLITGVLVIPFINLLYWLKLTRRVEAPEKGKVPLFDRLHDIKAGTPVGGGILLIAMVCALFWIVFPLASYLGVFVQSAFSLKSELFVIFFTFVAFGLLGLSDDLIKIFGKGKAGSAGIWFGLSRRSKFILQWTLALIVSFVIYKSLGIHLLHIPLLGKVLDLGPWYIPFGAFVIVAFSNAFNITDGLDGLSSGLLAICLLAFGIIAAGSFDTPLSLFVAIWVGALIAFLYFNVWPARIFLGDTGALSFGATLGVMGLLTGHVVALVIIGGIFVLEVISSAVQILGWKFLKRPIFPLAPFHHALLAIGWEEPKIVMRAWLAGIMLAIFGLWLAFI